MTIKDMNPKKSLGQHWLHDKQVLQSIADEADITPGEAVLEIGPGLGTLTDVLLQKQANLTTLEFDHALAESLLIKYSSKPSVVNLEGDIRKFNFEEMPTGYKVVANIPYYLTSHLVRQLAESKNKPSITVLLIQKEVAQRICAKPGQMSLLSVIAQWYFDCRLGVLVGAELFTPPPKVDSQVVVLTAKSAMPAGIDEKLFIKLVKAGFSEKRKTLCNALHGGLAIPKEQANELLKAADIDQIRRAQTLTIDEWVRLYNVTLQAGSL